MEVEIPIEIEKPKLTNKRISILGAQVAEKLLKKTGSKEEAAKVLEIVKTLLNAEAGAKS